MSKPVVRSNHENSHERAELAIYAAMGRAASYWELLEAQLCLQFVLFTKADREIGRRAYGAVASFRGRSDVLLAAAEMHYHKRRNRKGYLTYRDFLRRVGDLSVERNQIVHAIVGLKNDSGKGGTRMRPADWSLMPAPYLTRKHDKAGKPRYALSIEEIEAFIPKVDGAIREAGYISSRLTNPHWRNRNWGLPRKPR